MLIEHTSDVPVIAAQALAAPISLNDTDGVRVLLEAGADPRRYRDDGDGNWQSTPVVWALIGSSERRPANPDWAATVRILLDAGADTSQISLDPAEPHYPNAEVVAVLRARGIMAGERA